tara:strand:- start:3511 stop:3711 length:201 start_codon:yes stop_codon:yes gene_type:complete
MFLDNITVVELTIPITVIKSVISVKALNVIPLSSLTKTSPICILLVSPVITNVLLFVKAPLTTDWY